jgi:hypothetical protein
MRKKKALQVVPADPRVKVVSEGVGPPGRKCRAFADPAVARVVGTEPVCLRFFCSCWFVAAPSHMPSS